MTHASPTRETREPLFPGARRGKVATSAGLSGKSDDRRRPTARRLGFASEKDKAIDDELEARERSGTKEAEVYCVSRPFQEWGKGIFSALPRGAREALLTAGVAHFMLVYRDLKTGEMRQFDFGPVGGDVHDRWLALAGGKTLRSSEQGARETVYAMTRGRVGRHRARRKSSCVQGEIRDHKVRSLPDGAYLVGTTHLSLDDIRGFNDARDMVYELHVNDCRHYLNDLCYYLTRETAVSSKFVKHGIMKRLEENKGRIWEHHLWLTKALTDVENVENWNKAGRFASATLMFGMGTRFMPFVPAKRFVTWGSGVVAGTSENVPIVREVLSLGGFLVETGRSALSLALDAQNSVTKSIAKGVEAQLLRTRSKLPMPRGAKLTRAKSFEDSSPLKIGLRVSPSSLTLPAVAASATKAVRSVVSTGTNRALMVLNSPIKRINSFGRNANGAIRRLQRQGRVEISS